jgi:multidrug efflux system membrane fusion protein
MKQMLTRLNQLFLGVAAIGLLAGCERNGQAAPTAAARPPAAVIAAAAITRDVPVYLDQIGKTVPVEMVTIVPQVGGKVIARHVEDGAYVRKGDLLFEIDPRPFEASLASAKAALAQSQAEAEWATSDFQRTEELKNQNVASQLEYDQKKSTRDATQAKIEAANAAIQTAQLNLEYCKIYAPITGRAGAVWVDPGNIVKANEGTMLIIQQLDPIYAEFTVTENDLGTVRKFMASRGQPLGNEDSLGLKCEVDVPGNSKQVLTALENIPATQPTTRPNVGPREGSLTFLDNTVQQSTGTIKLRATIPNSDRYFWPGQFVNVRLILTVKKDAVLIPTEAQQIGQQGPFVYVIAAGEVEDPATKEKKPAKLAQIRTIVPGQRQGNLMVVEKGVNPGDEVVVSGQMLVVPGGPVNVLPNPAAPGSTAVSEADRPAVH